MKLFSFQKKMDLQILRNLIILETLGVTKVTSKVAFIIPTFIPSVQTFTKRIFTRRGRNNIRTMIRSRIIEATTIVSKNIITNAF